MASHKATAYGSSRTANAFTVTNSGAVFNPASGTSYAKFTVTNTGIAGIVYVYGFPKDIFYYFGYDGPERYDGSSYELHIAALNWSEIYIRDIYGNVILTIPSASSTMPTGVTLSQRGSNIYDITVSGSVLGSHPYDIESVDLKSLTSGTLYICGIDIEITYTNWNVQTDYYVYGTGSIEYQSGASTTSTVTEAMMNQQGQAFKGYPVSDTEEQTLLIHPSSDNDQIIVTLNNVDVSSKLITVPSGGSADLGAYALVSGGFSGAGATYFSGLVGKGDAADVTSSNYYASLSGTKAVFTYDVGISLPAGTTITNVYLRVSGHAESTSNADEYMCVQLKSGNTYFSDQFNFKSTGTTSNTVQTVTSTTIPTIAQLAEMKVECTLGYYGGAINGATLYVEIAGSGPATKKLVFTSHDKICWNYNYMEWGCVQVFIGSSAISNVYSVDVTSIGPYTKAKFICFPPLGSYLYSDNYPGGGFAGMYRIRTAALTLMKLTTQSNEGYLVVDSIPADWYSVPVSLLASRDGDSTIEYAIANKHTAYAKTGSSTWETGPWYNYTGSQWVNTTTPRNFFGFLRPGQSFKSRSLTDI